MTSASLNAGRRERELEDLGRTPVDLLVIGGGVTGAGVALDAATRGLSVVLAEKHDLAFGTSRWSSKLVHGGLRYLASGRLGIAFESAVERGILLKRTAPHLVHAFPQLLPLLPGLPPGAAAVARTGLLLADALRIGARTSGRVLPRSRRIRRVEVERLAPGVRGEGLRGGLLFWDGQLTDDARLVTAIARTAAAHGAKVLTRCAAEQVTGTGAVLRDTRTGQHIDVPARMVVNATGVWAADIAPDIALRPSRGTHLVLPQQAFGGLDAGLTVPIPGESNRFVFALPAPHGRVYVGLTDEETPGPIPDVPESSDAEIDFLLATISSALAEPVTRSDLLGTFAGLRPLLATDGGRTADLSRTHRVLTGADGVVTVVGGKLTTYRRMAADAVDAALSVSGVPAQACRTHRIPLVGAAPREQLDALPAPRRLVRRYGTEAPVVLEAASTDPELLEPVADGVSTIGAELVFALRHEGAMDIDDLLDRRTRIGLSGVDRERARFAAERVMAVA